MKKENDWYLIEVTKTHIKEVNWTILICTYSNGLNERQLELKHGENIETILSYERLD